MRDHKKMGFVDGVIIGGGFFLGYFFTKWLVAIILILTVVWGTCALVAYNDSKGRTDPITRKLIDISNRAPDVFFSSDCPIRTKPSLKSEYMGSIDTGRKYKVIDQKKGWREIIISGFTTGWTKCHIKSS